MNGRPTRYEQVGFDEAWNLLNTKIGHSKKRYLFDLKIAGATDAAKTEIAAATEVFDGTSTERYAYVWSDSADDTDNAAKDVRQVTIIGINSTGYVSETVQMNGLTAVKSTNTYARVLHFYASDWGTAGADAKGNISLGFDVLLDGDMSASTNWTEGVGQTVAAGVLTHTTGNATECTQDVVVVGGATDPNGLIYNLTWTIATIPDAGTVTPNISNVDFVGQNSAATFSDEVTGGAGDNDFAIVADAGYGGTMDNFILAQRSLVIIAAANESNGSRIYVPSGYNVFVTSADVAIYSGAVTDGVILFVDYLGFEDVLNLDPDIPGDIIVSTVTQRPGIAGDPLVGLAGFVSHVKFSDLLIGSTEAMNGHIHVAVWEA
jgi:hypothetical protein